MSEETQNMKQAEVKVKPLSENAFLAFFQKIWRWWLGVWYGFAEEHPKAASLIYMVFFFIVFSEGVTIWQYIVMTFLPYAFGYNPAHYEYWGWAPFTIMGVPCTIFGDAKGLGYFIAYEIAVFTAQCINFPLQRNITYKSKGNPVWQAMWYFIGWVVISLLMNLVWGVCNCFLIAWHWPDAVITLIKTVITGGVSMVVFFFIFMIIFPDMKKAAEDARKKAEAVKASGAPAEKIAEAEKNALAAEEAYKLDEARKNMISASSTADAKAVAWNALKGKLDKAKGKASAEEIAVLEKGVAEKYAQALEAAQKRDEAIATNENVIAEVEAARAARA